MTAAVTLHQPWATLVAVGAKTIETRSWAAPKGLVGARLLIHAATKRPPYPLPVDDGAVTVSSVHPIGNDRYSTGIYLHDGTGHADLPLGAIVASCTLAACVPMVDQDDRTPAALGPSLVIEQKHLATFLVPGWGDVTDQRPYGDFAPGRWAWLLDDVQPTTARCPACWGSPADVGVCRTCHGALACEPVPARGFQRIWWWTP